MSEAATAGLLGTERRAFRRPARARIPGVPHVPALPVVGIIPRLLRDPAKGLLDLFERHGPVFTTRVNGPVCLALGPEANETVLKTNVTAFSAGEGNREFSWLMGEPVETIDGDAHRRVRAALHGPLKGQGLRKVAPMIGQVVHSALASWETVGIVEAMRLLSLRVIVRVVLGGTDADLPRLERLFDRFTRGFFAPKIPVPGLPYRRSLAARDAIDDWLLANISAVRVRGPGEDTVLELLLRGAAELTPRELLDNLRIMVFAGQETTASIMSWAIIHLALDRALWQAVCDEVPAGQPLPDSIREAQAFPVIRAILNEALRRYTPAWYVPRRVCTDNAVIHGHALPSGTMVAFSPLATHHMHTFWPDPFRFDVTRWGAGAMPPGNLFLPFGNGPHTCLGAAFAMLEMTLVLAALAAARWRPELCGHYDLRPQLLPLPHPPRRVRIQFVPETGRAYKAE
jgi:cytochrome P450